MQYILQGDVQAWMKGLHESLSITHNVLKDLEKNVKIIVSDNFF